MTFTEDQPAWAAARAVRAVRGHETRTELLEAACVVFGALGYARTTVVDVTTQAGVSRPTFYAYFASKEAIFVEVAARVRDEFLAVHEMSSEQEARDPLSLGLASTAAYLAAYAANKDLLTVIEHQAISDPSIAVLWSEIQERPRRRVARYVRRMMAEGVACPAASPEVLSQGILGMFSRLGQSVPPGEKEFAALVRESTAMYLRLLGIEESAQEVPG